MDQAFRDYLQEQTEIPCKELPAIIRLREVVENDHMDFNMMDQKHQEFVRDVLQPYVDNLFMTLHKTDHVGIHISALPEYLLALEAGHPQIYDIIPSKPILKISDDEDKKRSK